MARVSRKAAIIEQEARNIPEPERVYNTAVYARLSVEDNNKSDDRESITMQRYMLEKYVEAQADMRLCGVFCDNGETGTNFERPEFERLMDGVRSRMIDCIVVKDLSRFGRNYVETGYYLEKIFPCLGVRFIAVNDGFDSIKDKNGNELVVSLKNLVNDLYAKDISHKVNTALETKQRKGEFIGAFPPYGYLKSPEDKHKLVPDPETAPVVREIFEWRAEGIGVNKIARYLNDRKISNPSMYHYLNGRKKKKPQGAGAIWQGQTVKLITRHPVYAGHMAQGRSKESLSNGIPKTAVDKEDWIIVYNTHEPIIRQDIFDRVQALSEQRYEKYCNLRGKYPSTESIFKGLVVCGDCGTKMIRYKDVSHSGKIRYIFICRVYAENLSGQGCTKKCVGEPELIEAVFHALRIEIEAALKLEDLMKRTQKKSDFWKKQEAQTFSKTMSPQNQWIKALKKCQAKETITREMAVELIHHIKVTGYNEIEIVWNFKDELTRLKEKAVAI